MKLLAERVTRLKIMELKNDYFKHRTRTLLTEEQKRETIEAIRRGCQHLSRMTQQYKIGEVRLENVYQFLYLSRRKMVYISRWGNLIKGYTQPKYLYRHRRRMQITNRAYSIAKDTGADFEAVKAEFFALMPDYVRLDYP